MSTELLVNVIAAVGTLTGLIALAAATFVFRSAPDPRVAWRFGGLLVLEAVMVWTMRTGPLHFFSPEGIDRLWWRLHLVNDGLLVATYLPAVAVLIRSRLLAPFEASWVFRTLLGLALVNGVCVFAFPDFYVADGPPVNLGLEIIGSLGPGVVATFVLIVASYSLGLLATLLARRSARGPLARRRATVMSVAFGARDFTWGFVYAGAAYTIVFGVPQALGVGGSAWLAGTLLAAGGLAYVCLIAYGALSANLFDIDLKLKWTLERGTIAAIFIAMFFMVSEGAEAVLSERLGTLVGILATGALVFALAPLQRAAERLADQAMPSVQDTPEYASYRKLQVYGEAVADAMRGGAIAPVDRVVLDRLRVQLGLDEADAAAFDRELGA